MRLLIQGILIASLFFLSFPALASTYYVSVYGSDTNPGTEDHPWKNIQRCVDPDSPLKAGDICEVKEGVYTSTISGRVVVAGAYAPSGSPGKPITIRAATPGQVKIEIPPFWPGVDCEKEDCPFAGFYITKPYYSIAGFEIVYMNFVATKTVSVSGIALAPSNGSVIWHNDLHDIARNLCQNGTINNQGILLMGSADVTIEKNRFYTIGRLRNGEKGCVTSRTQDDHGINAVSTTNVVIRRNLFWDVDRGFAINVQADMGMTMGLKIYHNTIVGSSPTGIPDKQISLGGILQDVRIVNNIFYNPPNGYMIGWRYPVEIVDPPGVFIAHNLTNSVRDQADLTNEENRPLSGITMRNNITGSDPSFIKPQINEFRLRSGSRAVDNGLSIPGMFFSDARPDIGAYDFGTREILGTGTSENVSGTSTGMAKPPRCI